jgi:glyoxylase-like metal-dependent hydrolase (beta-lactamase superfamily II)
VNGNILICLLHFNQQDKLLFAGGSIVSFLLTGKQMFYADSWEDMDSSIQKVKTIAPEITFHGHGRNIISRKELLSIK